MVTSVVSPCLVGGGVDDGRFVVVYFSVLAHDTLVVAENPEAIQDGGRVKTI